MKVPKINLHDRKTQAAIGGAGAVVAYALYKRHQAAAGGASSATATPGSTTDALDASSLENNIVGDLQPEIDALNTQVGGLTTASAVPPPTPPGTKPTPAPVATPQKNPTSLLPTLNSKNYALRVPKAGLPGNPFDVLGTIVGAGGEYTGENVIKGAPVYALIGDVWEQNFDPSKLAKGTELGTFSSLKAYITPNKTTERL